MYKKRVIAYENGYVRINNKKKGREEKEKIETVVNAIFTGPG